MTRRTVPHPPQPCPVCGFVPYGELHVCRASFADGTTAVGAAAIGAEIARRSGAPAWAAINARLLAAGERDRAADGAETLPAHEQASA